MTGFWGSVGTDLENFLGGATVIALLIGLSRKAIAIAIQQAATKEIESHRAALAVSLEAVRATYARELEAERQEAARMLEAYKSVLASTADQQKNAAAQQLEAFKAQLTLGAEVRRQVAAQKVKALLKIVELGEPLIREIGDVGPDREQKRAERQARFNEFMVLVRANGHFFSDAVTQKWHQYSVALQQSHNDWEYRNDSAAFQNASGAYGNFLDIVRDELGIEALKPEQRS